MFVYLFTYMSLFIRLFCEFVTWHFSVCRKNAVLVLSISGDLKVVSLSQRQNLLHLAFTLFCDLFQWNVVFTHVTLL